MKRIVIFLIAVAALLTLNTSAAEHRHVEDGAELMSPDEIASLDSLCFDTSSRLCFDISIVTVTDMGGKSESAFADDWYDHNGYGYGNDRDGCLLLVHMDSHRGVYLSACGNGITLLSDRVIDYILDNIVSDLTAGDYYTAFTKFVYMVGSAVEPSDYTYDTGYDHSQVYPIPQDILNDNARRITAGSVIFCIMIGLVAAIVTVAVLQGQLKSVKPKLNATDYYVKSSLVLTGRYDRFVGRHVTRIKRAESTTSGGSSVHHSSSGASHSGGGRSF